MQGGADADGEGPAVQHGAAVEVGGLPGRVSNFFLLGNQTAIYSFVQIRTFGAQNGRIFIQMFVFGRIFGKTPNIRPFYQIFDPFSATKETSQSTSIHFATKLSQIFGKMAEYLVFCRIFGQKRIFCIILIMANFPNQLSVRMI